MRSENMAKVALNAVILPEFEPVNGISWSPRTMVKRHKSCIVNRQIGVRDFKYVGKICPLRIGHVIRRMRSGCRRIVNGILWEMSELISQERIAVGSSLTKVKRSKVKVTRSRNVSAAITL